MKNTNQLSKCCGAEVELSYKPSEGGLYQRPLPRSVCSTCKRNFEPQDISEPEETLSESRYDVRSRCKLCQRVSPNYCGRHQPKASFKKTQYIEIHEHLAQIAEAEERGFELGVEYADLLHFSIHSDSRMSEQEFKRFQELEQRYKSHTS